MMQSNARIPQPSSTVAFAFEGTAMISGLDTSPVHFPGFGKTQLFHLRADLPHSWVFPEHSCRRNRNPSIFENHVFLREMLKWYSTRLVHAMPRFASAALALVFAAALPPQPWPWCLQQIGNLIGPPFSSSDDFGGLRFLFPARV